MSDFLHDYIVPGDYFSDQTVLCMSCATIITRLNYTEMPMIGDSKKTVNVVGKMVLGNYTQTPVIMYRNGKEMVVHVLTCKECRKFDVTEKIGDKIISQIKRAMKIEAKWKGYPDEAMQAIDRKYADARIMRKLTADELIDFYSKSGEN